MKKRLTVTLSLLTALLAACGTLLPTATPFPPLAATRSNTTAMVT